MSAPLSHLKDRIAALEKGRPVAVGATLVLIITVAVLSGAYRRPMTIPPGCPVAFLAAQNLLQHGTFSTKRAAAGARPRSGRPIPPAYPFVLALAARADPRLAQGLDCEGLRRTQHQAGDRFQSLRLLQAAAGIGILVLVFYLAVELTGSRAVACAAVVLYVVGGKLGEFARTIEPDNFRNLATFVSLYLLAVACRKKQSWLFGAAGASLGVAALFYPLLAILLLALPLALAALPWLSRGEERGRWRGVRYPASFLLGGLLVVAPWAARNAYLFGDPMLTDHAETLLLSFRVAFNAMPYSDWPFAVLNWTPSYGNVLARFLFGEAVVGRFGFFEPGAYFANGHAIFDAAAAGTPPGGNPYFAVWSGFILADPVRHLLTSIPIFTRGMWGTHGFMGIVGLCLLPRLWRRLKAGPNPPAATAVTAFAFLLVAIQSLLAPNFYWMNTPMLLLMSLAIAHALPDAARWLDPKLGRLVASLALSGNRTKSELARPAAWTQLPTPDPPPAPGRRP